MNKLPEVFYVASWSIPKSEVHDTKLFTDVPAMSAYLTHSLREYWQEDFNGINREYLETLLLLTVDNLKTIEKTNIEFSEITIKISKYTAAEFIDTVVSKMGLIGQYLHST